MAKVGPVDHRDAAELRKAFAHDTVSGDKREPACILSEDYWDALGQGQGQGQGPVKNRHASVVDFGDRLA